MELHSFCVIIIELVKYTKSFFQSSTEQSVENRDFQSLMGGFLATMFGRLSGFLTTMFGRLSGFLATMFGFLSGFLVTMLEPTGFLSGFPL